MSKKVSSEKMIKDIRPRTRTKYSSEEKIRIVLDGIRAQLNSVVVKVFHPTFITVGEKTFLRL